MMVYAVLILVGIASAVVWLLWLALRPTRDERMWREEE